VLCLLCLACGSPRELEPSLEDLPSWAYRPFEARLSLETGWAPCLGPEPGEGRAGPAETCTLSLASARCSPAPSVGSEISEALSALGRKLERSSGPDRLHVEANLRLLWQGDALALGKTLTQLRRALEVDLSNPAILNDLSAASLQLAVLDDRPDLLLEAHEEAQRALELDPELEVARFNAALALTKLALPVPAREAWEAYLELDAESPWAEEARRHLSELEKSQPLEISFGEFEASEVFVDRYRQRAREWAERDLMAAWAREHLAGEHELAAEKLELARRVAKVLTTTSGDWMLADELALLGRPAADDELVQGQIARGHLELAEGYRLLYEAWDLDLAAESFGRARRHFTAAGSPFEAWVAFYEALVTNYRNRHRAARDALRGLATSIPGDRYPALSGRIAWVSGLAASALQDVAGAENGYARAVEAFCRMGEEENLAAAQALLASLRAQLGSARETWALALSAIRRAPYISNPVRYQAILEDCVFTAKNQGLPRTALAFCDQYVVVAERAGGAQFVHNARMRRASLRHVLGQIELAAEDFQHAMEVLETLQSPELEVRADADRELERAGLLLESDPEEAVHLLSSSIRSYLAADQRQKLLEVYGLRGSGFERLGELERAERDYETQIEILDLARRGILVGLERSRYAAQTEAAFDRMIRFQAVARGDPARALRYLEQAHQTVLLEVEGAGSKGVGFASLEAFREALPGTTAVLTYALLPDRLLVFLLTQERFEMAEAAIGRAELSALVDGLLGSMASSEDGALRPSARELHEHLVGPIAAGLGGVRHLVVVPDKELARLPFAALLDAESGRFLIEDFSLAMAPSLDHFVRLAERDRELAAGPPGEVLVVTGNAGSRSVYPALSGARESAEAIVATHVGALLLEGQSTSPEQLLELLSAVEVFHFAGHAVSEREVPHKPRLILDDREGRVVSLPVEGIAAAAPKRLRLVVLAACSTARAVEPGNPVPVYAWELLSRGVPGVVGTLWPVVDSSTARLFEVFHQRLAEGESPESALREAQLALLRGSEKHDRHPYRWAGFVFLGASTRSDAR